MTVVYAPVVLLTTIFIIQQHASARLFTAECTKNPRNQFLCATNPPNVTFAPPEGMDRHYGCAMKCTLDKRCQHFNYHPSPVSDESCQLYYSTKPISYSIINGCEHYHAQQADAVSCYIELHGFGYNYNNLPSGPDWYRAVAVNGIVFANVTFLDEPGHGIYTYRLDPGNCKATDMQYFNTHNGGASPTVISYIHSLTDGTIIIGVSFDDAANELRFRARQVMLDVLGVDLTSLVYRGKFVFVAQIGSRQKTLMKLRDNSVPDGVGMDVLVTGDQSDLQLVRIGN